MLYVRGETGEACARALLACIEQCEHAWEGDRAYRDVLYKLDQVEEALDILTASAGHRAAMRASEVSHSGQEPSRNSEHAGD